MPSAQAADGDRWIVVRCHVLDKKTRAKTYTQNSTKSREHQDATDIQLFCFEFLFLFLCPRYSKNGGGALSVTPVRACVRACVRVCVRPSVRVSVRPSSKLSVRLIPFERLHRFDSNLVC